MTKYENIYVVGLGASAGGFEAFQKFLQKLPQNPLIAYVIVQHLDPNQPTLLGDLLNKYSKIKITPVKDGDKIKPNHIFYCPPNKDVTIKDGVLRLSEPEIRSYPKPSINKFFSSLAREKGSKAVGIVLSGTGSDGAIGAMDIANSGGIVLTEDEGAKYYSMPKAAIDTGKVLASLPPELLAEGIENVIHDRNFFEKHFQIQDSSDKIFELLNKKTGIDFSSYKEATITRRIKKRINETKSTGIDDYLKLLEKSDEELENLKDELLIIVTSFFRGVEAFDDLKKELKLLIKNKIDNNLRIWIPGCATGEEAYSIAIVLCEIFEEIKERKKVIIFATDVSERTIEKSRNRVFTLEQVKEVDKKLLDKYFEVSHDLYKPTKIIRDMIVFSKHDVIKDPPFLNLDLVSCRNLLIYFDIELQKRIISIFYYSMKYNSILFLGQSETIGSLSSLFSVVHNKHKIYRKSNDMGNIDIDTLTYVQKVNFLKSKDKKPKDKSNIIDVDFSINKAISLQYAQNGVVIDSKNYNILFYKGDCKDFLSLPKGIQTSDIFKMVDDYLKLDLRATINEAKKERKFISSKKIRKPKDNNLKEYVIISAFPLEKNKLGENTIFVSFDKYIDDAPSFFDSSIESSNNSEINILEDELYSLKERLQITIEELETSNEELQSTNEELQSTNEELQSTNEELETSNEELQSTNEELQTVNDELTFANLELEFANKAFNNVLSNIDSYVLILDKKLNIIKYTDGIMKFFDITRSEDANFSTIILNSNVDIPNLMDNIKESLNHNKKIEEEIIHGNRRYWFTINRIDLGIGKSSYIDEGLILSFVDKTEIFKKDQLLFQQSKMASMGEMIGNIAHQWRQPLNNLGLSIGIFLDKYENNAITPEDFSKFNTKYQELIMNMSNTIDEFRNFFQTSNKKEPLDICHTINQAIKIIDDSFKYNNIELQFKPKDCYQYMGKRTELAQVFLNILSNSKDAFVIRDIVDRKVTISVDEVNKFIKVDISDNAGGVNENDLKNLSKPYYSTKKSQGGSGIGLYLSEMILKQLNGEIQFKNIKNGLLATILIPKRGA
jgi:two-component system CheB/CheR fusion protein